MSRDKLSLGADFAIFFRCGSGRALYASGNVSWLHFRRLVHPCGCTKHLLRVNRHCDGDGREPVHSFLRPRNRSVPSYRPTQTRCCTSLCASEAQVRGRGSTQGPRVTLAICTGAEAGVQANAQGQGKCLCAHERSLRQEVYPWQSTVVRLTL